MFPSRWPGLLALAATLALAACGGGGGGGGTGNNPPTASFAAIPTSGTAPLLVNLNAAASSDSDGSIISYSWNFGDNSTGSGVSTGHNYTTGGNYTITLTVTDNGGKTAVATQTITVSAGPPPTTVTVSGKITYERVPFNTTVGSGLDYSRTSAAPARGIVVELLRSSDQSLVAATVTDSSGNYSFGSAPVNTSLLVRAQAQSVATGTVAQPATWNIQVKNNTNSNALYVMDSAAFNTGVTNQTRNLLADSGWPEFGGTTYSGTRVAAPFAILDSIYTAAQFVVTQGGDASIALPALDVFWSPSNRSSDSFAPATGNIQTTQYRTDAPAGIYVLGEQSVDTDEYDEHVLTHEFQHYLGNVTSRDDSVGGAHSLGEKLDVRVAFSEGYANAFSAMALNDPVYRDSSGSSQLNDSWFDMESTTVGTQGWFNESTLGRLGWDLFDSAADASDTVAIPYASIQTVFRNELRTGQPLTSIFPLIVALKAQSGAPVAAINTLVEASGIVAIDMDAFATTETNTGGVADALPLYRNIALNGAAVTVCGNHAAGTYNALGNRRFLKFSLASTVNATIHVQFTSSGSDDPASTPPLPDPDIVLYKGPFLAISEDSTVNQEDLVRTLDAGDYVIEVYEYSHIDPVAAGGSRGRTCMNVTITG